MAKPMFKNLRVYILASVAYMGSFLFGMLKAYFFFWNCFQCSH